MATMSQKRICGELYATPTPADQLVEFFDSHGYDRIFNTDEGKLEFIGGLSLQAYGDWLDNINNVFRAQNTGEALRSREERMHLIGYSSPEDERFHITYSAPQASTRVSLFAEALTQAKKLESSKAIGALLGYSVITNQAMQDANHRTGDVVQQVFAHGYDGSAADRNWYRQLFGISGPHDTGAVKRIDLPADYSQAAVKRTLQAEGYDGPLPTKLSKRSFFDLPKHGHFRDDYIHDMIGALTEEPRFNLPLFTSYAVANKYSIRVKHENTMSRIYEPGALDHGVMLWELVQDERVNDILEFQDDVKRGFVREIINAFNPEADSVWDAEYLTDSYQRYIQDGRACRRFWLSPSPC